MLIDGEKLNEVLKARTQDSVPMRLPGMGVMLLQSAIRLLCLHPDYKRYGEDMKGYVQEVRDWCLLSMRRMGLDEEIISYLDADEKEDDPGLLERLEVSLSHSQYESYTIHANPVSLTIIHGALLLMLSHPEAKFTPASRQLIAEIRAACIRMYGVFGLSQEDADFLDTH